MKPNQPDPEEERRIVLRAFAMTIRELRSRAGISQENLAYEAGVNRAYMSGIERAKHSVGIEVIYRMLQRLGVTFGQFGEVFEQMMRRARRNRGAE